MTTDIRHTLRAFIEQKFLRGARSIKDDDSLYETNIIDSLAMLELVAFVETTFDIVIGPSEVTIDHFDSVSRIAQLIERKKRHHED